MKQQRDRQYKPVTGTMIFSVLQTFFILGACNALDETHYKIGVGIGDVTGPSVEVGFMGYADPSQTGSGIHLRQYSRAFIFSEKDNDQQRVVFASVDCGMMSQVVKLEVVKLLKKEFGGLYTEKNVLLSGTHTHSGVAGYIQYLMFGITNLGFVKPTFQALVDGIMKSIRDAHNDMKPGNIYYSKGELLDASINRSPTSYLKNPEKERAKYKYDVDKDMHHLKLVEENGLDIGAINWFAVHATSMNNTNTLVSSDNKGLASLLLEKEFNPNALPGKGKFIAAFASSNLGDVSPNTKGPRCMDTGLPCDLHTSTCNGKVQMCVASGPGRDMFESTEIIARRQFAEAFKLHESSQQMLVTGPIKFVHQFVYMPNQTVKVKDTNGQIKNVQTCQPAMGYSFAAGTTDGPGAFDFKQGTTEDNPFWNIIRNLIRKPSIEQVFCHAPKPILLDTGEIETPYDWSPKIVDPQILQIGNFLIVGVPGEFTTMSGRRVREAVKNTMDPNHEQNFKVVIAGLSNTYSDYVATYEEYQVQRYEGASTIFGPHTLAAYVQRYKILADALKTDSTIEDGPSPPNLLPKQLSLLPGVLYDRPGFGKNFGDCVMQPPAHVYPGETVKASFVAGNPRNNLMLEDSFLEIQQQQKDGDWKTIATDASWETKFHWKRTNTLLGESLVTIEWTVPPTINTRLKYRMLHRGHYKLFLRRIVPYSGSTLEFKVAKVSDRPDQFNSNDNISSLRSDQQILSNHIS